MEATLFRHTLYEDTVRHSCVTLSVLLTFTAATVGQEIEPTKCVRPAVAAPQAFVQTPLAVSLPMATTINVRAQGAAGNGTTIDSNVIQSIIDSNPNGTIYFPLGLYRLHNDNQTGLVFKNFHGTAIMQNGARFLCDTVAVGANGECIRIFDSSNAAFGNFRIGYIGDRVLPYTRSLAGNTALLVEDSQNITLTNTTIEHSPGPGIWVDSSSGIKFVGGTSVSDVTADGLHFENDANSSVDGYFSQNTGDDGLGISSAAAAGSKNCGVTATNLQIYRSLSVGISVHGACTTSISNFYIDTTANAGLLVTDDPSFNMLGTTGTTFANGTVLSSGRFSSPIVGGKDCVDISQSQGTTLNSIACVYPLNNGVFVDSAANAVTLNAVTVDAAPNLGFGVVNATNVWLTNTVSRNSAGGGYVFNTGFNEGSVSGAYACNSGKYGFYHAGVSNVAESNLVSYDSSEGNSSNRAWWAENGTTALSLNGIALYDDITTTPIVVGAVGGNGSVTINGVSVGVARASALVQLH